MLTQRSFLDNIWLYVSVGKRCGSDQNKMHCNYN